MSNSSATPWSSRPNALQVPSSLYHAEKEAFVGVFIGAVSYGITAVLFFRCLGVLLSPVDSTVQRGIRWTLVAHTMATFSLFTIPVGVALNNFPIFYINNREFPGNDRYPPGPMGYSLVLVADAIDIVVAATFPLNQWLADGLLLRRCYIICSMNHWVMALPYLMYLASVALGIANIYQYSSMKYGTVAATNIATSYYSTCLLLNILLTFMIVTRLTLHIRDVGKTVGASEGSSGLHTVAATVVTMLIESYALYAVALLSYVVSWAVHSGVGFLLSAVVGATQVIAPYLIILRVAKRRATASESISLAALESIRFRSQGPRDAGGPFPNARPTNPMEVGGGAQGELGAEDENVVEGVPL